jgi:hypothetical protein
MSMTRTGGLRPLRPGALAATRPRPLAGGPGPRPASEPQGSGPGPGPGRGHVPMSDDSDPAGRRRPGPGLGRTPVLLRAVCSSRYRENPDINGPDAASEWPAPGHARPGWTCNLHPALPFPAWGAAQSSLLPGPDIVPRHQSLIRRGQPGPGRLPPSGDSDRTGSCDYRDRLGLRSVSQRRRRAGGIRSRRG